MGNRRRLRQPRGRYTDRHEPSARLRTRLDQMQATHRAGRIWLCEHLAAGGREPGITALWSNWIVCGLPECRGRLLLTGAEDRRGDRCGEIVDTIHPDIVCRTRPWRSGSAAAGASGWRPVGRAATNWPERSDER
jgi:hypothetical protein